jgi:hypothetical protein
MSRQLLGRPADGGGWLDPPASSGTHASGSMVERLVHAAPCPIMAVPYGWDASVRLNTIGAA